MQSLLENREISKPQRSDFWGRRRLLRCLCSRNCTLQDRPTTQEIDHGLPENLSVSIPVMENIYRLDRNCHALHDLAQHLFRLL